MTKPERTSYVFVLLTLVVAGWLHLATPLLAALFSYFVLSKLHFSKKRLLTVSLFVILILGIGYGLAYFFKETITALPAIADKSIPSIISWAEARGVQLPFADFASLKALAMDTVKEQVHYLRNFANVAKIATTQLVFLIIGMAVAVCLFLNPQIDLDRGRHAVQNNLYSLYCEEIAARFQSFYRCFATVIGAQIIISSINTVLTSSFVLAVDLPHPAVVIGVTFLCGLLPVVGNLISNTVIVCIAFTVSPNMALGALAFLIVIHKLEYFLNSKIIGDRIRNPVWLTLLGLVLGERLMGIPGMILAPVVLNYLKVEASRIPVEPFRLLRREPHGESLGGKSAPADRLAAAKSTAQQPAEIEAP